jgi:cobalt-zinc-cadmium efflux system membrane fusion protein
MRLHAYPLLLACLVLLVGCKRDAEPAAKQTAPASSRVQVVLLSPEALQQADLQVEQVQRHRYKRALQVSGVVKPNPNRLVDVSWLIPGRAIEVLANVGDRARQGEVLARVDSTELGLAQSEYLKSQAHLNVAEKGLERAQHLLEAKVIGTGEYQRREGETLAARADHRAAGERLILLGMAESEIDLLARTQRINSKASIRAPLEGTVIERHVNRGEVIDPKTKLFVVADLSQLWVMADVHEKDIPKVQLGQPVEIHVTPYPDEMFRGVIMHIGEVIEPATRTAKVRTEVPNPDGRLKAEMFATVKIVTTVEDQVLAVPGIAVQRDRGRDIVFVRTGPNQFEPREVVVGEPSGDIVPIVKGVSEGEEVVTKGSFILKSELNKKEMEPA